MFINDIWYAAVSENKEVGIKNYITCLNYAYCGFNDPTQPWAYDSILISNEKNETIAKMSKKIFRLNH